MLRKALTSIAGIILILGSAIPVVTATATTTTAYDPFFAAPTQLVDYGAGARPFGIAAGDFTGDGRVDVVTGRVVSAVAVFTLQQQNEDGTYTATQFPWRVQVHNQWTIRAGDVDGDGKLDLVWGSLVTTVSTGCTISGLPAGPTCEAAGGTTVTVNPGDVRMLHGNGDGTFAEGPYFVSGVRFAGGTLLARIGTAVGSVAIADIDGDLDNDIVAGGVEGTNSVVKILRNDGSGLFTVVPLISQPSAVSGGAASPTYFPATTMSTSPWGLAFGDADGDGDQDLWVGDRALYVYLYKNNGTGAFTLTPGDTAVSSTRPNVYLAHEGYRPATGYTPSLVSADFNGDGKADLVLGLQSGTQSTPIVAHDGELVLDVSTATAHTLSGTIGDIGMIARGVSAVDANGDGPLDIVAGEYNGKVMVLRQLPPIDSDGDGISDYVDNAPAIANAARLDMNGDGSINRLDQLDNDFDTVLGNPEDPATWQRLGDPADPDDDNDLVPDASDNCIFAANTSQADADADGVGDACDPLDATDTDGDGVPDGPLPGDPLYAAAQAAAAKWASASQHFVIRIDALGRWWQSEFTQTLADAAMAPDTATFQAQCAANYAAGSDTDSAYRPDCASMVGGKNLPISLAVIPKMLWTDPTVVSWINARNDSANLEIAQHGAYHVNNNMLGDWKTQADRNWADCETCGLTVPENLEMLKVGRDTLLGNYGNLWVAQSGATGVSPKIDWASSINPLITYIAPYDTSDTMSRDAMAQLGYLGFSASWYEEAGGLAPFMSPEGSHMYAFDQFGMFHGSAYRQVSPGANLQGLVDAEGGNLHIWLIEEVDWSAKGTDGAVNDKVDTAKWAQWNQLLDFVASYPDSVAMTIGEVALAKAFDNAPTVPNPDQADTDADGIGDVVDGAQLALPASTSLNRNVAGTLSATLTNGNGTPIAGQQVTFTFDADNDGTPDTFTRTTDAAGIAQAAVTATCPVGPTTFSASWDGLRATASATGSVEINDATGLTLDNTNPTSGQVTDSVTVGATLVDSDHIPLQGRTVDFSIDGATGSAITDASGHATATLTLQGPAATTTLEASFTAAPPYGASTASASFTIAKEDTSIALTDAVASKRVKPVAQAALTEADGAPLSGQTIDFYAQSKVRNQITWVLIGSAATDSSGTASFEMPSKYISNGERPIKAVFQGDGSYWGSSAGALAYRN